ncbi:MAG: crossover junction endodeoxyribonuclease RuvC [Bdellovibrionales bacterium]|nr:crossover junction endodeoxyribonuclease RuvC [Bdellovibrionales bacterium]
MTTILGIDPGSQVAGYGIIQVHSNNIPVHKTHGCIRLAKSMTFSEKLAQIYKELSHLIRDYQVNEIVIEKAFLGKNVDSALKLGQVRGVCLLVAGQNNLPVYEYAPASIKKKVTGAGNADKEHVRLVVLRQLGIQSEAALDATDALAMALCHSLEKIIQLKTNTLSSLAKNADFRN